MKRIVFASIMTITLLNSCISAKKFTGFVEPKFDTPTQVATDEQITFDLTAFENSDPPVTATTLKSQFIPAVLYWQWNSTLEAEVNPTIVGQLFQENILRYADSLKIHDKLQGRKLELKLEKAPNHFVYSHKGNTIIFLIAYTINSLEAIFPIKEELVVGYKLLENETTIKSGTLTIEDSNQALKNIWKSPKKFTWRYIGRFKENTASMSKILVDRLSGEI